MVGFQATIQEAARLFMITKRIRSIGMLDEVSYVMPYVPEDTPGNQMRNHA
jgi:hypothetical protein